MNSGPVVAALLFSGRAGSALAAEIGLMKIIAVLVVFNVHDQLNGLGKN